MEEARKAEILARLESWLEALGDDEPLPEGLDPSLAEEPDVPAPDLAALAGAVAASAREFAILARSVKRLAEAVAPLPEDIAGLEARVEALKAADPAALARAAAEARAEVEDAAARNLMELFDRLERSAAEARRSAGNVPLVARWTGGARTLEAVARGVELTLERLEEILERAGVRRIVSTAQIFDARTMRAVDTVPAAAGQAAETVVATLRAGFVRGDLVLRPADVRVAQAAPESRTQD
ncbi:MAG: nucleotide exchange factor GrpE [Planctomycetes bacterium]|nr:nucleotide exchange factor GrpE [Planctomycetota bacterium]